MRSKTILFAAIAGAFAVPFAAFADSDSYGQDSPSVGASADSGTSAQGSPGATGPSADTYGQDRNGQYAQNEERDRVRADRRGRDGNRHPNTKNGQYGDSANRDDPARNGQSSQSEYGSNPY